MEEGEEFMPPVPDVSDQVAENNTESVPVRVGGGARSNDNTPSGDIANAAKTLESIKNTYKEYIVGQEEMLESILVALLSNGHLLIEGVPGLAKTTAAHTIAATVGADFTRIQCTPDMLPADIVGSQIYNPETHQFKTQLGPVNHQFVLVDEVNRTSAKTQSALLEAMQERQVSIGGETHKLPRGFIVMATQNPIEQEGTYPLPEAQLDRFMLKHIVRYPSLEEETEVLRRRADKIDLSKVDPVAHIDDILSLQESASNVTVDEKIVSYVASLIDATRHPENYGMANIKPLIEVGASPRASLALLAAGRAKALLSGDSYVTPDHIKPFLERVLQHRLVLSYEAEAENITVGNVIEKIASVVQVP